VLLSFPHFVEDAGYFYDQLSNLFERHAVSREMVQAVHKRLADPSLVHRFATRSDTPINKTTTSSIDTIRS
jgi:hypothetical protein